MAFSDVNKFLANFDGGARPNRYLVLLTGNPIAQGKVPDKFQFLCRSSSIPSSTLAPCMLNYMGREIKVPGDRTFDDWTVTVYNTKDWKIRTYFESWSDRILTNFGNVNHYERLDESGWMSDATVWQLDRNETPVATYMIKGLYPTSISDIPLAYDNNNTVEEFTVTFTVNYWISKSAIDGNITIPDTPFNNASPGNAIRF